jgi:hypothetical protein
MDSNTRVLQDLVYERIRDHIDLVSLVDLERELAEIIERARRKDGEAAADAAAVSRRLFDEAWQRLEAEWRHVRDSECPLCAELDERPARLS